MIAEALCCRIRQARQAVEVETALVLAEALGRQVGQARQAVQVEKSLVLVETLGKGDVTSALRQPRQERCQGVTWWGCSRYCTSATPFSVQLSEPW